MCEKCEQLEVDIERYRKLTTGLDPLTIERIEALILELQKRKEAIEH
jgi:ABC-type transporter Mla maintaining outer membrane lipid asymmetry ATPase subunit MlaF